MTAPMNSGSGIASGTGALTPLLQKHRGSAVLGGWRFGDSSHAELSTPALRLDSLSAAIAERRGRPVSSLRSERSDARTATERALPERERSWEVSR